MNPITPYSQPENPVRHSYPLKIREKGFLSAAGLCMKTLPFMAARLGLLVGFTIVTIIWFGITLAISSLLSRGAGGIGVIALFIGFGFPFGIFMWFRKYVLYVLKMAHIAVLTRLITHGEIEQGFSQVTYGKSAVTNNFGEVNLLFVLDELVQGIVRAFTGTLNWIVGLLPLPGVDGFMQFVDKLLQNATTYIDETIFSYNLARGDENKWRSSRDGLIYYAQNWKPILKTAGYALVLEYVLTFVAFVLCLAPAYAIGAFMPQAGGWVAIFAILLALNFKSAVLHPLFLTMVMVTYHDSVYNQAINPEWDARLTSATGKFNELTERARTWVPTTPAPAAAPVPLASPNAGV